MPRLKLFATVLALGVCLFPFSTFANPWNIIGFDSAGIGRGNALAGGAQGASSVYYNPAGLIKQKRRDVSFSYVYAHPLLRYQPDENTDLLDLSAFEPIDMATACASASNQDDCESDIERYNQYVNGVNGTADTKGLRQAVQDLYQRSIDGAENPRDLHGATIGMAMPLAINPEEAFAAAGIGIFVPFGPILYQRIKGPTTPYFLEYDDFPHRIVVDAAGAIEVIEGLRLGVGADILVNVNANVDITTILPPEFSIGNILSPDPNFQDILFYIDGKVDLPITITPIAGIQYSPTDWVDVGVRFRNEQRVDINAQVDLLLESAFGTRTIPAEILAGGLFTPRQVAGGFAFYPLDGLSVMADVTWKQWSRYIPPFAIEANIGGTALAQSACDLVNTFQDLDELVGDILSSIDLGSLVSGDTAQDMICSLVDSAIPSDISISVWDKNDKNNKLKDIIAPSFGIAYEKDKIIASAGYQFDPNPVPEQNGIFNILDADTHMVSGYLQYQILSFATAGVHLQYQMLKTTHTAKSSQRILSQTNDADGYPDAEFDEPIQALSELEDLVRNPQILTPGYPGYEVGGGYLTVGLQFNLIF
ncbi:MAG: hypothetical protein D6761_10665 [Candidatus Dadabacteria bacterium]|nr:MAG: hypothetical protein D6761_10665 [Candidatus Dadabacteria bacterium]